MKPKKVLIIQPDLFDVDKFNDPSYKLPKPLEDKNDLPLFTPDMIAKLDTMVYISEDRRFRYRNPMVEAYGQLTTQRFLELVRGDNSTLSPLSGCGELGIGTRCNDCQSLTAVVCKVRSGDDELAIRRKYNCKRRGTCAPHRANWQACMKFTFKESI